MNIAELRSIALACHFQTAVNMPLQIYTEEKKSVIRICCGCMTLVDKTITYGKRLCVIFNGFINRNILLST